jgi:hypothetical protein
MSKQAFTKFSPNLFDSHAGLVRYRLLFVVVSLTTAGCSLAAGMPGMSLPVKLLQDGRKRTSCCW